MPFDSERQIFGRNLLALICSKNWSVQRAAAELGYDLSEILSGRKNFKLETAVKFARFFNTSFFLLFSRLFREPSYQENFPFEDADYMCVLQKNFLSHCTNRSAVDLDATTLSHILHGRRRNVTISTVERLAAGANISVAALLMTESERQKEHRMKGEPL